MGSSIQKQRNEPDVVHLSKKKMIYILNVQYGLDSIHRQYILWNVWDSMRCTVNVTNRPIIQCKLIYATNYTKLVKDEKFTGAGGLAAAVFSELVPEVLICLCWSFLPSDQMKRLAFLTVQEQFLRLFLFLLIFPTSVHPVPLSMGVTCFFPLLLKNICHPFP